MRVYLRPHKQQATWCADLRVLDPRTGQTRRKRKALPEVRSRAEAEQVAREVQVRLDRISSRPKTDGVLFRDFAAWWMRNCASEWSPTTARVYEQIVRLHLTPWFGDRPLGAITPSEIVEYRERKLEKSVRGRKAKPKTVANQLITLSSIFSSAVDLERITRNPARAVKLPKAGIESDVARSWTVEEARRFLQVVKRDEPDWLVLFWFAMRTGLRLGELAALTWGDIDFERGIVTVRASLTRGHLKRPKNERVRTEPIPAELSEMMLAHRSRATGGHVFTAADGRELTRDRMKSVYERCIREAGVPRIRIHDLRHTFGKHLASHSGASQRVIQELMGHVDPRSTERYTKVDCEDKRAAVDRLPPLLPASTPEPGDDE